uniref:Uncharacterized protein n=1 Tax=Myotis myotis TaxID=51298 RepID=A0A7J7UPQ2_MYOMY|nr:hypothetical protein mMyoMyo1_008664 [Myotis myotis]
MRHLCLLVNFLNYGTKVDPAPRILWRLDMMHPEGLTGSSENKISNPQTLVSFTQTELEKHNSFYHNSSKGHTCGRRSREPGLPPCSFPTLLPSIPALVQLLCYGGTPQLRLSLCPCHRKEHAHFLQTQKQLWSREVAVSPLSRR